MYYASYGLFAIIILFALNREIIFRKGNSKDIPALNNYRYFLFSVLVFYTIDMLWGVFDYLHYELPLYIDTIIFFISLPTVIIFWTLFVTKYLEKKTIYGKLLVVTACSFLAFMIVSLIINFFKPIVFYFDDEGYHAGVFRYVVFGVQVLIFLLTSLYTFIIMARTNSKFKKRYQAIGFLSLSVGIFLILQLFYPLLPLYTIAYMIGTCLLYSFVIEIEKNEYRSKLKESIMDKIRQTDELNKTKQLALIDQLTGVKNTLSYAQKKKTLEKEIEDGNASEFAIAIFDLNGLKKINDTYGHENGDQCIIRASKIICDYFKHSPVYRIGGDEFVAIIEGIDYTNRETIMNSFIKQMFDNAKKEDIVVSMGMSEYIVDKEDTYKAVFDRADKEMYSNKQDLKSV